MACFCTTRVTGRSRGFLFLLLLPVCLGSCRTNQDVPSPYAPVYVTDRGKYGLLPPWELETPMDMPQQISGVYGKREMVLEAWVQADDTKIDITLFSSLGAGIGEVVFREGSASFSSPLFPSRIKPEYIIADFQFCFYRAESLSRALKEGGLTLRVEQGAGREIRTIAEGKKTVIVIEKTEKAVRYTNYLRGYAYTLAGNF